MVLLVKTILVALLGLSVSATSQIPLGSPNAFLSYDDGLFSPVDDMSVLTEDRFTMLAHPSFPRYSVRMKKSSDFCDESVKSYTGYIDIEARHIFFYFFESRSDPDKDDVIFWTNGGPGCSSSLGLFMELGPCRILDGNGTKYHPESWNSNANVFFVDQPIGVGFSYADHGETVSTTEEAAKDIAAFVAIFFENFSKFKGRAFHMAGESYGGRYVPLFAAAVYDQNSDLVKAGRTPINLKSIMIGNGVTDFASLYDGYYQMTCTGASVPPFLDIQSCVDMKLSLPRCQAWLESACIEQFDKINCRAAVMFCDSAFDVPFFSAGRSVLDSKGTKLTQVMKGKNPYDVTQDCTREELGDTLCYPALGHIAKYLSSDKIRTRLGVDPAVPQNFSACSLDVGMSFSLTMDMAQPTYLYVAQLLERGVKALIYVGANDWICNWVGNEAWTLALEWSGQADFVDQPLRDWEVEGTTAGRTRSAGGFTFATITGAGHMVPYDKPKESLQLVQRWLSGSEL